LYNSKQPVQAGVNPITFSSLDEYIYYIKVQRYKYGQYCPVLYLQQETNAQGQDVYRMRPSPFNPQAGLPTQLQQNPLSNTLNIPPELLPTQGPNAFSNASVTQQATALQQQNPLLLSPMPPPQISPPLTPYIDANHQPPYNQGYYGFDPTSQYVGKYTVLDQVHDATKSQFPAVGLSTNPMDPNWAGIVYTNEPMILSGPSSSPASSPAQGPDIAPANTVEFQQAVVGPIGQLSPEDPMNPNWIGGFSSKKNVDQGKYSGDNVSIQVQQ